MDSYTVIARKYRPQLFSTIVGQELIVTTLKNSLRMGRTAHAYLFAGPRGTGKTTIARVLAKALNCHTITPEAEPCNMCPSCQDITAGKSLDVLEIDGASNRGIDDIRAINETVHYATSSSKYRIYIIDEVHMLTKEAFNALLKTLEEPPQNVKFFMATTEPQRIPPTIISRCQRFDLARIRASSIADKLQAVCNDLGRKAAPEALKLIAHRAEGGLRDAESLLDQILNYSTSTLSLETVTQQLGLPPRRYFFALDEHFSKGDAGFAFKIIEEIFETGYDPLLFLENLAEHYRMLLLLKYDASSIESSHFDFLDEATRHSYTISSTFYSLEQCLFILDLLVDWLQKIARTPHLRIALECIVSTILRSRHRVSFDILVRRIEELESQLTRSFQNPSSAIIPSLHDASSSSTASLEKPIPIIRPATSSLISKKEPVSPTTHGTPAASAASAIEHIMNTKTPPISPVSPNSDSKHSSHYDTLIHFAAVELEGSVKINMNRK